MAAAVVALAAYVSVRRFVVSPYKASASSTYPALNTGDQFAVWRRGDVRRGDLIVFEGPKADLAKRVIGVGGDRIEIDADGVIALNGARVPRCPLGAWPDDRRNEVESATAFLEQLGDRAYVVIQRDIPRQRGKGSCSCSATTATTRPTAGTSARWIATR